MKITVSISPNSATDLKSLLASANDDLEKLEPDADWTIEEVELWGRQDADSKDGLLTVWNGTVKATATVGDN